MQQHQTRFLQSHHQTSKKGAAGVKNDGFESATISGSKDEKQLMATF